MKIFIMIEELVQFCDMVCIQFYVIIDMEFLCEWIYYFKLCFIQMVVLDFDGDDVVLVDLLVGDMLFELFYELFCDILVVKVFYVVCQDFEIFFVEVGVFFELLFDIQVVVMVCGFGE